MGSVRRRKVFVGGKCTYEESVCLWKATNLESVHRWKTYVGGKRTKMESICRWKAYIGQKRTSVESVRRWKACVGGKHA